VISSSSQIRLIESIETRGRLSEAAIEDPAQQATEKPSRVVFPGFSLGDRDVTPLAIFEHLLTPILALGEVHPQGHVGPRVERVMAAPQTLLSEKKAVERQLV
jgi:hypothetical protein